MEAKAPEHFFYHSFPRPRPSAGDQIGKGLRVLRSMCHNGLLLVPERVSWTDPTGTRPGDKIHAFQRRISFTELAPHELRAHSQTFGPFALEYGIAELRGLGALPVIYVPDPTSRDAALDWAGASLLGRLADAQHVVRELVRTQQLTAPTIEMELTLREGGIHRRSFDERETTAIRDYVALIQGAPNQRLAEILGALHSLSSLFYPTEHLQYTGLLGYYRQREWRLYSGALLAGQPTTSITTDEQRQGLLEIDPDFFSKTLPFPDGEATLAAKSHYMSSVGGRHILSLASHIVVPATAQRETARILNECGLSVSVVPMEDLPTRS